MLKEMLHTHSNSQARRIMAYLTSDEYTLELVDPGLCSVMRLPLDRVEVTKWRVKLFYRSFKRVL